MTNFEIVIICLMVYNVVGRHPPTTLDVDCGNPKTKAPATLTYKGDAVAVFGYGPKEPCRFRQDIRSGGFIIKISYNVNDTCSFTHSIPARNSYYIKVESRLLHELFEGADDEKFLVECAFGDYKLNVTLDVELQDIFKPVTYLLLQNGKPAKSTVKMYLAGVDNAKLTGAVKTASTVLLRTQMIPFGGEKAYMPMECLVESEDGKVKVLVLAGGCGTGYPWKTTDGFTMNKLNGDSLRFKMFRISKKQGVVFRCSFIVCNGACDGTTCPASKPGGQKSRKRRHVGLKYDSFGLLTDETRGLKRSALGVQLSEDKEHILKENHNSENQYTKLQDEA